jgi:aminoglycoside 3-N-acetyltransferase
MKVKYQDILNGLRKLGLRREKPVIAHVSLSSIGEVRGGAETVLGALLASLDSLIMPAFTYKTVLIPMAGPADNGMAYGTGGDTNRVADYFGFTLPCDRNLGVIAECLRLHTQAKRSMHPILSFSGVGVETILEAQTLQEPLAPIRQLWEQDGWVLLVGLDHRENFSLHLAEKLAGRKQFTRWALTPQVVRECPGIPGCSQGFNGISPFLTDVGRRTQVGNALLQAIPLADLIPIAQALLSREPQALLCANDACERCEAVRKSVQTA